MCVTVYVYIEINRVGTTKREAVATRQGPRSDMTTRVDLCSGTYQRPCVLFESVDALQRWASSVQPGVAVAAVASSGVTVDAPVSKADAPASVASVLSSMFRFGERRPRLVTLKEQYDQEYRGTLVATRATVIRLKNGATNTVYGILFDWNAALVPVSIRKRGYGVVAEDVMKGGALFRYLLELIVTARWPVQTWVGIGVDVTPAELEDLVSASASEVAP